MALLSSLAGAQDVNPLPGVWSSGQFGEPLVLQLNANGTGTFDGVPLQYEIKTARLTIRLKGHETVYTYSCNHDQLMISGGDLEGPLTFRRNAQDLEPSLLTTSHALIGLWSGNGEMVEFRADGKCRYGGSVFTYKLSQGHIVMETPGGNQVFEYVVSMGKLALSADGERSVFTRVIPLDDPDSRKKSERNPSDLVGQWCYVTTTTGEYSGRCITFYADATYRYAMESSDQKIDSGTWYVEENRLYYQSKLRGAGFYQLERRDHPVRAKEPMIVLDNEPFVFVVNRLPR